MTTREYLHDVAVARLGNYGKGSAQVEALWRRVLEPGSPVAAQVKNYASTKDWCGGHILDCLHEAGLAKDVFWKDGSGFVLRLVARGLLKVTRKPQMMDIGIKAGPPTNRVWHHFWFEGGELPANWDSLDGNTPVCARKHHTWLDPTVTFYDIGGLLPALPEAGFVRGQEHSVPGIQDK